MFCEYGPLSMTHPRDLGSNPRPFCTRSWRSTTETVKCVMWLCHWRITYKELHSSDLILSYLTLISGHVCVASVQTNIPKDKIRWIFAKPNTSASLSISQTVFSRPRKLKIVFLVLERERDRERELVRETRRNGGDRERGRERERDRGQREGLGGGREEETEGRERQKVERDRQADK